MDKCFLGVGTRVEFYQDGLRGNGVIAALFPDAQYCYHVRVDWCDKNRDGLLHDCNGSFPDDVGWMVEYGSVLEVLGYEECEPCEIGESDLDAILGM